MIHRNLAYIYKQIYMNKLITQKKYQINTVILLANKIYQYSPEINDS